jgi:hypothetical protein
MLVKRNRQELGTSTKTQPRYQPKKYRRQMRSLNPNLSMKL